MIRVLVCDDQSVVREGLRAILGTDPRIEVVGVAAHGADAVSQIPSCRPDLVLMDLKMPVMNGVQATRALRREHPEVRVLVLTTYDADEWVFDAVRAGACGYLLKDTPRERLLAAIHEAASGRSPVDPAVAGKLLDHVASRRAAPRDSLAATLTERETEVLALVARGFANAGIAARLGLSEGTVRNHVSAVLAKLGVADRTQAAILAVRCGLVADEE